MMQATQIRRGMIVLHGGKPHRVLEFQHRTPGNLRGFVQARLRNLETGTAIDVRYSSTDNVDRAVLDVHEMEYIYSEEHLHHFMNTETYEQLPLDVETLSEAANYLAPGIRIKVEFYDGKPIGVELPSAVELTVVETEPELRGATASNSPKPAKLETGIIVQVPPFIKEGDRIRVDPTSRTYLERAK